MPPELFRWWPERGPGARERREAAIAEWFLARDVGLAVAAGWLWILTPAFLDIFRERVVNVHPTLLPAFPGRQYGADTLGGLHSVTPVPWTEEYQTALLEMSHRVFDRVNAVVGEQIWNFADFATVSGINRVDGNKKGVFTRDRRPKAVVHHLRRRWRQGSPP